MTHYIRINEEEFFMGINPDFLINNIFSDMPVNWLIHSQGFHHAGLKLVEAMENSCQKDKCTSTGDNFKRQYTYKVAVYLFSHAIELLLKAIVSMCNKNNEQKELKQPAKYSHN